MASITRYDVDARILLRNDWKAAGKPYVYARGTHWSESPDQPHRTVAVHVPRTCRSCGTTSTLVADRLRATAGQTLRLPLGCGGRRPDGKRCTNRFDRAVAVTMPKRWR